ncbi:MAG: DUF3566 domain-containing protein [bacterium]|nr:MAG: DUF3566 domain-containing protein [bacterium]
MIKTYEIRRIPVWPVAKVAFVMLLVIGIIIAIIYSIIFSSLSFLAGTFGDSPLGEEFSLVRNLGFVIIPIIALTYAVFGTIAAIIWVLIYNLVSSIVGGVGLELQETGSETVTGIRQGSVDDREVHVPQRPIDGF